METKKSEKQLNKEIKTKWYLINAQGKILGKVAVSAASLILGKNDPIKKSYELPRNYVVITNASKVAVTGKKEDDKKYYRYSGYPSGLRERTLGQLRATKPEEIINHAVFGMLPKNRLGRALHKHLFVYAGADHTHEAQKPEELEVK